MATLQNTCSVCYKATAPECAGSYSISGLTPDTEYVIVARSVKGHQWVISDAEPVDENGNLVFSFPEGVNSYATKTITVQLFLKATFKDQNNFCDPETFDVCEDPFTCIELSFYKSDHTFTAPFQLLCKCEEEDECPEILQTVSDITDAPIGTEIGQLTLVKWIDGSGNQYVNLYEWDGADWVLVFDGNVKNASGFVDFNIDVIASNWEVSVDSGAVWGKETINFDPPVEGFTIWFRNTENGCVYKDVVELPLDVCINPLGIYDKFDSIPDGSVIGAIAMVAESSAPFINRNIYEWDGSAWVSKVELSTVDAPSFTSVFIGNQDSDWEFRVTGVDWNATDFPETSSVTVEYRKISTGCIYTNDPITPSI